MLLCVCLGALLAALALLLHSVFAKQAAETEKETPAAEALPPFVPAEHTDAYWQNTISSDEWPYFSYETLTVYADGTLTLRHDSVTYRGRENGGTYLLEKDMYASPFDPEPALTLQAGEVRFFGNGETVRIEAVTDPLGVFAGFSEADMTLRLAVGRKPYRSTYSAPVLGGDPPYQPSTDWTAGGWHREQGGMVSYASCNLHVQADSTVRGTFRRSADAKDEPCELLWASDAAVLVRPQSREPAFFGSVRRDTDYASPDTEKYLQYTVTAYFDPYALRTGACLFLRRISDVCEPKDVLGRERYSILGTFTADGWKHEPLSMKGTS